MLNIDCKMDIVLAAAQFYARYLEIDHYPADVEIVWLNNPDQQGYCGDEGNGCYEIGITMDGEESLETLAHEFVHLYQYLTGALRDIGFDKVIYLDKVYPYSLDDYAAYKALPFEAEAFARQEEIYLAFIRHLIEKGGI